jgi:hypothetical protein
VAASQKREVRSRLRVICEHLLKWRYRPRRRPQGWRNTLDEQRRQLQELFEDSPSLRGFAESALPTAFVNGRQDAEWKIGALGLPDDVCNQLPAGFLTTLPARKFSWRSLRPWRPLR